MEDKKPFKETKLGAWLSTKAPEVLHAVGDMLPDQGVLGIAKNIVDKLPGMSAEDKEEYKKLSATYEQEIFGMVLGDVANARNMQVEALRQNDQLSKRFIYYMAWFIVASATAFGFMLFFVKFPDENKRMIEMFADVYMFAGALMILNFFYGSSKGSHDKTEMLKSA